MSVKVNKIAEDIFKELDQPKSLTITQIWLWLRSSIGRVNAVLYSKYEYDKESDEFIEKADDENEEDKPIDLRAIEIFKHLYFDRYYKQESQRIRNKQGTEYRRVTDGDRTVELANTSMMARELNELLKQNKEMLDELIEGYFLGNYKPKSFGYLEERG